MGEHGPFNSELDALTTRAGARLRDAFDAAPVKAGAGDAERLALLTEACEESGVDIGGFDAVKLRWLARWEDATVISVAGLIHRAYRAGLESAEPGDELGWVVVTRSPFDPNWDIDTPGLHHERETAALELGDRRRHTASVGRGERHEVAAVIRLEGDEGQ